MTTHSVAQYLKYRLKAKTRHGVHSPFVYNLIERVLKNQSSAPFHSKLAAYLENAPVVLLDGIPPDEWLQALNNIQDPGTALILRDIHRTSAHTLNWNSLAADERVRLSIDIYSRGLLFFRDEFKEKQHFVLKYPA